MISNVAVWLLDEGGWREEYGRGMLHLPCAFPYVLHRLFVGSVTLVLFPISDISRHCPNMEYAR
jgi:hypothetical protein